jgi:hypothetical protein
MQDRQNTTKEHLLAGIQAAALPVPQSQPAPALVRVLASGLAAHDQQTLTLRSVNDGPQPLHLAHAELRYWLDASAPLTATMQQRVANVDRTSSDVAWASPGPNTVVTRPGREQGYPFVALRFVALPRAMETLAPYGGVATVALRVNRADWAPYALDRDWSYTPSTVPVPAPHLTLTMDGRLMWGVSPLERRPIR